MHKSKTLSGIDGISHGFFSRKGGHSQGIYQSLNCGRGSDDDPDDVARNRRVVAGELGVVSDNLLSVYQIHSPSVVVVDGPWKPEDVPQGDAMVCNRPGFGLGILTADCAPVLLSNSSGSVIGAAHAGWKGALGGVIEATIDAMEGLGARRNEIYGVVGPCIRSQSYEVGSDVYDQITAVDPIYAQFFDPGNRAGHYQFDLPCYALYRLAKSGIGMVEDTPGDTYADEDIYFSYRRATHRAEADYGRQISAIAINHKDEMD